MSADRLRHAATVLRERAEAATSHAIWTGGHYWIEDYDPNDPTGQTGMQVEIGGMSAEGDAAYYALMSPPVALALADWLTDLAHWVEYGNTTTGDVGHALAVADAILGGAA